MALTNAITWKGKTWDNAYMKITEVTLTDYIEGTEKNYRAAITAKIYTDNTKTDTIDIFAPWHEYNTDNSGTDVVSVDKLKQEDLTFATYYRKLKEVPQISNWKDC